MNIQIFDVLPRHFTPQAPDDGIGTLFVAAKPEGRNKVTNGQVHEEY